MGGNGSAWSQGVNYCTPSYDRRGQVQATCVSGVALETAQQGPGGEALVGRLDAGYITPQECQVNCHPDSFPRIGEGLTAFTPLYLFSQYSSRCQTCKQSDNPLTSRCWIFSQLLKTQAQTQTYFPLGAGCPSVIAETGGALNLRVMPLPLPQGDTIPNYFLSPPENGNDLPVHYGDAVQLVSVDHGVIISTADGNIAATTAPFPYPDTARASVWTIMQGDPLDGAQGARGERRQVRVGDTAYFQQKNRILSMSPNPNQSSLMAVEAGGPDTLIRSIFHLASPLDWQYTSLGLVGEQRLAGMHNRPNNAGVALTSRAEVVKGRKQQQQQKSGGSGSTTSYPGWLLPVGLVSLVLLGVVMAKLIGQGQKKKNTNNTNSGGGKKPATATATGSPPPPSPPPQQSLYQSASTLGEGADILAAGLVDDSPFNPVADYF